MKYYGRNNLFGRAAIGSPGFGNRHNSSFSPSPELVLKQFIPEEIVVEIIIYCFEFLVNSGYYDLASRFLMNKVNTN